MKDAGVITIAIEKAVGKKPAVTEEESQKLSTLDNPEINQLIVELYQKLTSSPQESPELTHLVDALKEVVDKLPQPHTLKTE